MMIDSKIYKGIEYIQLNELPQTQREKIAETLNKELLIKIMVNGSIIDNCLQFKDYAYWYNTVYRPRLAPINSTPAPEPLETVVVK